LIDFIGRGERIRTSDPLVPNQVLYQAEPLPEHKPLAAVTLLMPGENRQEAGTRSSVPENAASLPRPGAGIAPGDGFDAGQMTMEHPPRYHHKVTSRHALSFPQAHVLDGGMASELEFHGADISGPLWSAHVLEDAPEKVFAVHRAYLQAGADVLLTASYQVSRRGFAEFGLDAASADRALLRAVGLAANARYEFLKQHPKRHVLIAASLGPYGASLHNGSEYHGNYDCSFEDLVQFHHERIAVVAGSEADLLAFETIPSLEEARAIGEALKPWPGIAAWFTFTCPDGRAAQLQVAHGEKLRECAALVAGFPQTIAVGINCTQPAWISRLIAELRQSSTKPIVVYPNSGEGWNAEARCWTGSSDPAAFGDLAREWYKEGAQLIGGCCRTRPDHIRQVASAWSTVSQGAPRISDPAN
jgi:homocysteine S-methyltransferase